MNTKEEIYKFFNFEVDFLKEKNIKQTNENYLENGLIDSMQLIEMIVTFEDKFKIKFSTENLQSKKFRTIRGLIEIITSLQNKKEN
jgi:acyl carrier protein